MKCKKIDGRPMIGYVFICETMAETRCIGKGKSIVTIARKLGELLYLILKIEQEYIPQKFIAPEIKISKLAEDALKCS